MCDQCRTEPNEKTIYSNRIEIECGYIMNCN